MNKNPLDYLDSIPVIGFSDLKSQFNNLDDTTEEGRYLLNSIGADTENRIFFYKKEVNNDNNSVLEKLVNNYNKSIKEGEEFLDFQRHNVPINVRLKFRKFFGKIDPGVILSLPKTKYTELRLLCGSNLEQIRKEVINDQLQTERINDFLEEYKIIKMFPPKVGKESVFNGFTIKTKNGDDGPYNAFLDSYGREIAKLVQVQQPEGNLRYTYAISFNLPSDKSDADHIVETIKKVTGDGDEVKQMNKNIITWKELGFPDPKDKNPDISHIHDLSNMSLTPIQTHKNYVIDDSVLTGMMGEPDIKEILTNTNNKMEQELSKNDLNKKLEDLQKQVSAQIIGMDFMEAKLETREATLFDSDVMEGALKEVSELDKEIRKDIEQYTPYATKDEEINSYVKSITKLKDKLGDVSNTINLYLNNSNIQVSTEKNNDMAKKKTEPQEQTPKETAGKKETTKKEGEKQPAEPKKKEVKESKKEEKKTSTEVKMSIPEQVIVGYGQLADIKNTNGGNVTPNVPKFRLQLDLSALESKKDKMNLSKNHDGDELMNFAVIRNKKAKENQSPYIVIVKRQGQPATVDGKEVKYSDASALMEFTVNMKEMKEKAEKAGVDLKENKIPIAIGSFSGPTGVKINDNSNLVKNKELGKDGYNLTLGKSNAVNQFDRIISTRRNLDTSIKDIRYSNKDMGEGITFSREVQMKNKSNRKEEKEYNMTLTDTFMKLSPKAIKELPEADAFGNIKLAVCTKRTDETYLKQNNLHLDDKKQLVNVEGKRVPDMSIVADPKTYKNGQPYENTVKTFMVRKDDLLRYPKLKDDKGNENAIAIKLDGLTGNVVLNVSQYVKNNQTEDVNNFIRLKTGDKSFSLDDKNKYQAIDATKIDTQTVQYKKDYAIAEVKAWKKTNPGLKPEDFKNAPSQFDIFKIITSELQAKQAKIIKESSKNDQSKDQDQNNDLNQNKGRKI